MSRRPIIGISSYARDGDPPAFSVPCGYVDAVRAAGATPLLLPPGETEPERLLDIVDGLILAGGGDIAPAAYDGEPHETIYSVSEERDQFEFALARAALSRPATPLLCICRGMQVLNVACGGSLHAHVPERFGDRVAHRLAPRQRTRTRAHRRRQPAGAAARQRRSRRCARGITRRSIVSATACAPIAWADDGVIEAIEHIDASVVHRRAVASRDAAR